MSTSSLCPAYFSRATLSEVYSAAAPPARVKAMLENTHHVLCGKARRKHTYLQQQRDLAFWGWGRPCLRRTWSLLRVQVSIILRGGIVDRQVQIGRKSQSKKYQDRLAIEFSRFQNQVFCVWTNLVRLCFCCCCIFRDIFLAWVFEVLVTLHLCSSIKHVGGDGCSHRCTAVLRVRTRRGRNIGHLSPSPSRRV